MESTQMNQNTTQINTQIPSRQLEGQLSSKSDWYNYFKFQCNMFMPPYKQCTMRFIRDVLKGTKILIKSNEIIWINVPFFPELSLKCIWEEVRVDEELIRYLNIYEDADEQPDRNYFFGILGTLRNEYLQRMVHDQQKIRVSGTQIQGDQNSILISNEFLEQLQKNPTISRRKGRALSLLKQGSQIRRITKKRKLNEMTFSYSDYINVTNQSQEEHKQGQETRNLNQTPQKQKFFNI